jgi:hypothetical protein
VTSVNVSAGNKNKNLKLMNWMTRTWRETQIEIRN